MPLQEPQVSDRERTPLEAFTQRIEVLTDRTREQRLRLASVATRVLGDNEVPGASAAVDRPDAEPGEYNVMNYAIDSLCNQVEALTAEVEKLTCRL